MIGNARYNGWLKCTFSGDWELVCSAATMPFAAQLLTKLRPAEIWSETVVLPEHETPDIRVRLRNGGTYEG